MRSLTLSMIALLLGAAPALADEAPAQPETQNTEATEAATADADAKPEADDAKADEKKGDDGAAGGETAAGNIASAASDQAAPENGIEVGYGYNPAMSKDWQLRLVYTQTLGAGTFIGDSKSDNPLYANSMTVQGQYRFHRRVWGRLHFTFEKEFTDSNTTTQRRQTMPGNLRLDLRSINVTTVPIIKAMMNLEARFIFPTSYEARNDNLIMGTALQMTLLRWNLKGFVLAYVFRYTRNWFSTTGPTSDRRSNDGDFLVINRATNFVGRDPIGGAQPGLSNTRDSLLNALSVTYAWSDKFSTTISYTLITGFGYNFSAQSDVRSSEFANPGENQRDSQWGVISADYVLSGNVGLSLYLSTLQPARGPDGDGFRFPFYDTIEPANNFTTWGLDVSFLY